MSAEDVWGTVAARERGLLPEQIESERLLAALKLARLHIAGTQLEHAIISLDHPGVGLGVYLDQVISETSK